MATRSLNIWIVWFQYNDGIPPGSRLDVKFQEWLKSIADSLSTEEGQVKISKIKALSTFAEEGAHNERPS